MKGKGGSIEGGKVKTFCSRLDKALALPWKFVARTVDTMGRKKSGKKPPGKRGKENREEGTSGEQPSSPSRKKSARYLKVTEIEKEIKVIGKRAEGRKRKGTSREPKGQLEEKPCPY